jgi:catechol 2,3-dioxygenase
MAPPQPNQPNKEATYIADPGTRIGHVHRSDRFAFILACPDFRSCSASAIPRHFLSAGGYDHHIALNTRESPGGPPPPPGARPGSITPLSSIRHVRRWPPRCVVCWPPAFPSKAQDHRDPDENGVELYCDRPRELWPRDSSGELAGCTRRLICKACSANLKPMSPCRLGHPIYSQVLVVKAEGRSRWSPLLPRLIPNFFLRLATFT